MTRYERQEQIYQDIQSVEAELDGCPRGSSRWFELHDRLHVLLQAYVAVPQDPPAVFDGEMRQPLEVAVKISCTHTDSSQLSFREACYAFRWFIWLTVLGLLFGLMMSFMSPFSDRATPWMVPTSVIMLLLDIAWAIWSSRPLEE